MSRALTVTCIDALNEYFPNFNPTLVLSTLFMIVSMTSIVSAVYLVHRVDGWSKDTIIKLDFNAGAIDVFYISVAQGVLIALICWRSRSLQSKTGVRIKENDWQGKGWFNRFQKGFNYSILSSKDKKEPLLKFVDNADGTEEPGTSSNKGGGQEGYEDEDMQRDIDKRTVNIDLLKGKKKADNFKNFYITLLFLLGIVIQVVSLLTLYIISIWDIIDV